jgi:hypothetical protein
MAANRVPAILGHDKIQSPKSGVRLISPTAAEKRHRHRVMMPWWLLTAAFVLVMSTTSCAPIPCAGGYADPNWCLRRAGGGGGN